MLALLSAYVELTSVTPQFQWCRTRFESQPQPVPPIFDPYVAARAIVATIGKKRRELYIAGSTVQAVFGSKLAPAFLDRYLATAAYEGQRAPQPLPETHGDNLFESAPVDVGVYGLFSDQAKTASVQTWLTTHRWAYRIGVFALVCALGIWALVQFRGPPLTP